MKPDPPAAPVVTVAVVAPSFVVTVSVALAPLEPEAAARASVENVSGVDVGVRVEWRVNVRWQNELPTAMILLLSTLAGHDSYEQSCTPLPKSIFVHRQVMLLLAHPRLGALASMFWMHVFCEAGQYTILACAECFQRALKRTPQSGRAEIALRSWATMRPANSAVRMMEACMVTRWRYWFILTILVVMMPN